MKKRIFVLLLVTTMISGLCACSHKPYKNDFNKVSSILKKEGYHIKTYDKDYKKNKNASLKGVGKDDVSEINFGYGDLHLPFCKEQMKAVDNDYLNRDKIDEYEIIKYKRIKNKKYQCRFIAKKFNKDKDCEEQVHFYFFALIGEKYSYRIRTDIHNFKDNDKQWLYKNTWEKYSKESVNKLFNYHLKLLKRIANAVS